MQVPNDNRCVQLLSNIADAKPVQKIRRYSKKDKQNVEIFCPNAVVTYNKFMGGVECKGIPILMFYPIFKLQFHTVP